ncbi:MAG: hypothetical protein ACREEP_15670 [Dongiaceae bacterium]
MNATTERGERAHFGMIGVGIIGFGLAGRFFHAPFIAPSGMALRAVATSRAVEVRALYPAAAVVTTPWRSSPARISTWR